MDPGTDTKSLQLSKQDEDIHQKKKILAKERTGEEI